MSDVIIQTFNASAAGFNGQVIADRGGDPGGSRPGSVAEALAGSRDHGSSAEIRLARRGLGLRVRWDDGPRARWSVGCRGRLRKAVADRLSCAVAFSTP